MTKKKNNSILSQWISLVSSNEKRLAAEKKYDNNLDTYANSIVELLKEKWREYFGSNSEFYLGYPLPGDRAGIKIIIRNYLQNPNNAICIFPYYRYNYYYKVIYPYKHKWYILSSSIDSSEKHIETWDISIKPQLFLDFLEEVSALSGIKFDCYQPSKEPA